MEQSVTFFDKFCEEEITKGKGGGIETQKKRHSCDVFNSLVGGSPNCFEVFLVVIVNNSFDSCLDTTRNVI